ncbi:MAG: DUF3108 domain-containing protein [Duganella sp.]
MTIASFFYQRRRLLVFCAATLALHGLAIDWAARNMAASSTREAQPAVMTAQLRVALPKRVESAPLAEVQPLAERPKAQNKPNPVPKPPSRPPPPPLSTAASRAITPVASDLPAPAQASVEALLAETAAVAGVEQAAPAAAAADAVPPAATPVPEQAPAARRYKVQLPPSATFDMDVARVDADGTRWSGAATMTWHTDGSRYRASVEAGISLLVTRLNLLVLRSEGAIDDNGIAPDKVTEKRARRAETATHFNRGGEGGNEVAKTITFSTSGRSFPLLPGAQDKATVPFQLAAIGRADVNQFGADIDIQVGEDKDAGIYRFQLVGEDELDTRMGKLITWHLTRPPKPGSYSSRLDIWLAPGLQWYPVQIRNTEASGALTTQTVAHIKQTETGQ